MAANSLGPRGLRLWLSICERVDGERGLVLLEEACRTADRLDRLDGLLAGDLELWSLVDTPNGSRLEVVIDGALSEARQQGAALLRLLTSLPMVKESGDDDTDAWLDELPSAVRDS
jgi:hypothetical protein